MHKIHTISKAFKFREPDIQSFENHDLYNRRNKFLSKFQFFAVTYKYKFL